MCSSDSFPPMNCNLRWNLGLLQTRVKRQRQSCLKTKGSVATCTTSENRRGYLTYATILNAEGSWTQVESMIHKASYATLGVTKPDKRFINRRTMSKWRSAIKTKLSWFSLRWNTDQLANLQGFHSVRKKSDHWFPWYKDIHEKRDARDGGRDLYLLVSSHQRVAWFFMEKHCEYHHFLYISFVHLHIEGVWPYVRIFITILFRLTRKFLIDSYQHDNPPIDMGRANLVRGYQMERSWRRSERRENYMDVAIVLDQGHNTPWSYLKCGYPWLIWGYIDRGKSVTEASSMVWTSNLRWCEFPCRSNDGLIR